jgi:3-oxoadipate enol-lactonase
MDLVHCLAVPHAEVNGQRLYYEVHGEGEPLVLVMGLSADITAWALQIPVWSQQFKVVAFDNRDVGQSSYADGDYEIADMAQDALALADHLELDSFHLVGVSMGGAIAQEMALAAPERIRTLNLCVTFADIGAWGANLARLWGSHRRLISHEEHVDNLMLRCFSEAFYENPEQVQFVRNMMLANPHPQQPEGFIRQLEASSRHHAGERLGDLSMPVQVIGAEYDVLVPVWKSREVADLIPGSKLVVLERAPHGIQLEAAEEFNRLVAEFVTEGVPEAA